MKRIFTSLSFFFFFLILQNADGQTVWINEINYDTPGTDTLEFVEIAGSAGTLLDNYSILYINGDGLATYLTQSLSGTIPNEKNGLGAISFIFTVKNKIQNGPDGIALVKDGKEVIQFLSYEDKLTDWQLDGKAYSSQELPFSDGNNAPDVSLQAGNGNILSSSNWTLGTPTPGKLNAGQGDLVLSLEENTLFSTSLESKEVEVFTIQGQRIEKISMVSGHIYLLRWKQGDTLQTRKILFDL